MYVEIYIVQKFLSMCVGWHRFRGVVKGQRTRKKAVPNHH